MINTALEDREQAFAIGHKLKTEVNKSAKNLEIEMESLFKPMLLLSKKKYAALKHEERNGQIALVKEVKGLDLVRRDWCDLSKDMGK